MIDNNICETFNSYIRKAREKSLIDMLEYIRKNLEDGETSSDHEKGQKYNLS